MRIKPHDLGVASVMLFMHCKCNVIVCTQCYKRSAINLQCTHLAITAQLQMTYTPITALSNPSVWSASHAAAAFITHSFRLFI